MASGDDEDERLRTVALETAQSILVARGRVEEALRKQTEWLRVTLSSIGDAVISTDAEGRVTFMNGVAEALTGWAQKDAIGRPLPDVFHIVNEYTRQPVENPALRALREGTIVGLANHTILIARDGAERPIDDSAAPMRDQQGPTMGAVLVFRDVSERKHADEVQERLAAIVASSEDAIVSKTLDGVIRTWNAGAERVFGYTAEEAVGQPITLIIPQERLAEEKMILARLREGERIDHFDTVRVTKDGRLIDISLTVSPLRDAEGHIIGASKIARDITERKRAEVELARLREEERAADRRAERILESVTDAFFGVDRQWRFTYLNPQAEVQLQRSRGDLIGKVLWEEFPAALGTRFDREYRAAAESRRAVTFEEYYPAPLDSWYEVHAYPSDEGLAVYFRNITEQRKAEEELRAAEQRTKTVLESITEGFVAVDSEWRFTYLNARAERIYGVCRDEFIGRNFWEAFPEALGTAFETEYRRAMEERTHTRVEAEFRRLQGWFEVNVFPVEDGGLSFYFRDVTERKRSEEELRESERRFREFADTAPAMLWVTEADGQCTFLSRGWYEYTGQTEAEALGLGWLEAVHPEDREESGRIFLTSNANQELFRCEYRVRQADGTYRWAIDIGRPRFSARGDYLGYVGSVIDVHDRKQAEEEKRQFDDRRRLALDAAQLGSWHLDPATEDFESDSRFREIFGVNGGRLSYREALNIIHPEDRARVQEAVAASTRLEDPKPYALDYRVVHPDGSVHWVTARGRSNFIPEGNNQHLTSFDGTVADITERKRVEEELRAKDERLNLFVENIKDYAVIISDAEGTVIEWQGGAERITGFPADEAIGQRTSLLFTPEDRAAGRPEIELMIAAGTGRAEDKRWHQKKDGSRFFADGVTAALYDGRGKLRGFGKVFKDATGEWRAEQATRRRAAQLQRLAEISARINAAHDVHSVIGVVTEEARYLIGARQAATSLILAPHDPRPINVVSTASDRSSDRILFGPDGARLYEVVNEENRPIRLTQGELAYDPRWQTLQQVALAIPMVNGWLAAPLVGRNGKSLGLLQLADKQEDEFTEEDEAILVQLSRLAAIAVENAKLYEELRGNDRRKDEFLAMLAHELRNPLSAISNAVSVTTRSGNQEHVQWSMEVITRQMKHLTRLIDDLLDVSRISRGKIELRKDVLDATPILDSALATVRPLADERKHSLEVSIDRGNLWVNADPTRLEQVVVNLLNNAAKYSENAGHIHLSAKRDGELIVISVRDRGVGIPPEKLPGMFELFAQGDRSLARSEGGLGIGLTVVKKLVEMHGGSVTAASEGLGKGSEFAIRLPARERPAVTDARSVTPLDSAGRTSRILVVDDNVDTARGMARLLKLLGHEVATAHEGHQALTLAREFRPDFILLDIGLPGMNGYEVASRLRQEECCKDSLIVAVSGYGQEEDRRRSKEAGFDHHLIKPLDHDALLTLLAAGGNGRP